MTTEGSRGIRIAIAALAVTLVTGACGPRPQVFAEGEPRGPRPGEAGEELKLPDPIPAVPSFTIEPKRPPNAAQMNRLRKLDGVAVAIPVTIERTRVSGKKAAAKLNVATVPVLDYRSVAPASTRAADFVWYALLEGHGVMTPDAAEKLKLGDSTAVRLANGGKLRLGALADNSTPNFADLLIGSDEEAAAGRTDLVVVGARSGVTLNSLAGQIRDTLPGARLTWLLPKTQTVATPEAAAAASGGTVISTPSLAGLHPALAASVDALIKASGGRVWLVSGYRDYAHQYRLWVEALQKYGDPEIADNWVAPPGSSNHERGIAVDLGGDLELAARLVEELDLPMWRPMSWEPWHFELIGSR